MATELKALPGKFRIVGVDLFDHEDYLVGDHDDRQTAFDIADQHNRSRLGPMDDVYLAYDDCGKCIRENVAKREVDF